MTSAAAHEPRATAYRQSTRRRLETFALDYGILAAALALGTYVAFRSPYFLTTQNLLNVGNFMAATGILVVGFTISLISGKLDLSIGGCFALASVTLGRVVETYHQNLIVGILAAFAVCWLVAVINSLLVDQFNLPSLIATLATGIAATSIAAFWLNGNYIFFSQRSQHLTSLMRGKFIGIPVPMVLLLLVGAIGWTFLNKTKVGWHLYALGGSEPAALRAGISPTRLTYLVFFITASTATIGAMIDAGRLGFSSPDAGETAIVLTAALMGGMGLGGGTGKMERAFFGLLLIGILNNGLTLLNVGEYSQDFYKALILIGAVTFAGLATKSATR